MDPDDIAIYEHMLAEYRVANAELTHKLALANARLNVSRQLVDHLEQMAQDNDAPDTSEVG